MIVLYLLINPYFPIPFCMIAANGQSINIDQSGMELMSPKIGAFHPRKLSCMGDKC